MTDCGCDPLASRAAQVTNPPGQDVLRWRVAPHAAALARMRARVRHPQGDPADALLDAWALVTDSVSFYTERIAQEGFLRTATERTSVRELARTIGYELRPGVAATADLAFTLDSALDAAAEVVVPAGTPVRSVPAQGQLPQTFETGEDLVCRVGWNSLAGAEAEAQVIRYEGPVIWLRGTGLGLRTGDPFVVVGPERVASPDSDRWDLRVVHAVAENPDGFTGWTRLDAPSHRGGRRQGPVSDGPDVAVIAFDQRAGQLRSTSDDSALDLDGDYPRLRPSSTRTPAGSSWAILESSGKVPLLAWIREVEPRAGSIGQAAVPTTRLLLDSPVPPPADLTARTLVLCQSRALPSAEAPRRTPVTGPSIDLVTCDPPLPIGRRVVVTGSTPAPENARVAVTALVRAVRTTDAGLTVTMDRPLPRPLNPRTLRVLANVVEATHGETVRQVLGSGVGAAPFQAFDLRRGPLTYIRAATPDGAASTLDITVDGATWTETESLATAGPHGRTYVAQAGHEDDGSDPARAAVRFGDGLHGARLPTGDENVSATYRVGIGADGALAAGQLSVLPQRPLGVRDVTNPAPTHDWAAPDTLDEARRNAPLRIRTLDRAVSVADHEDFAAAFAGVGLARADEVWDGRSRIVVVTVHGANGTPVSTDLATDLHRALTAVREPGIPLVLAPAEEVRFGVRVEVKTDPAHRRLAVLEAVVDEVRRRFAPGGIALAAPVTAADVLVRVRAVAGVVACTMPRLVKVSEVERSAAVRALAALPARFEAGAVRPAQLLAVAADDVEIEVMSG